MIYELIFRPAAVRDLKDLPKEMAQRVIDKIDLLRDDLSGDVKKLKNFVPRYRLRVGDWRVLFELERAQITIWRVRHRREVYNR